MKLHGLLSEWAIFRDMCKDFILDKRLTLAKRGRNGRFKKSDDDDNDDDDFECQIFLLIMSKYSKFTTICFTVCNVILSISNYN